MNQEKNTRGSGLTIFSVALLIVAIVLTFFMKQCIFGSILGLVAGVLATASYIEVRRGGGPVILVLSILIITWIAAFSMLIWTVSPIVRERLDKRLQTEEIVIEKEEEKDKQKKLEELQGKIEELEEGGEE